MPDKRAEKILMGFSSNTKFDLNQYNCKQYDYHCASNESNRHPNKDGVLVPIALPITASQEESE